MIEDLMEKYGKMTEEEFEALPEEEKTKIKAEIELDTQKIAKQAKEAIDKFTDEEKASIKETMEHYQEEAERVSKLSEEEVLAEMMNPETKGYDEEDLKAARELIKNQENGVNQTSVVIKKGIWHTIINFFKRLFR